VTSRRPMRTPAERLSRAAQFRPGHVGGRVSSAQPVQRRQRIGQSGTPAAPTAPDWADKFKLLQGYWNTGNSGSYDVLTSYPPYPVAGEKAIMLVASINSTVTPPAGWTSLAAKQLGRLTYWMGWITVTGSDDWTVDVSPAYNSSTWATSSDGYTDACVWVFDATTLTPQCAATEKSSSSSATVAVPTGIGPWSAYAATRSSFSINQTASHTSPEGMHRFPDLNEIGYGAEGYGYPPYSAPGSILWSYAVDSVTFAMSWA